MPLIEAPLVNPEERSEVAMGQQLGGGNGTGRSGYSVTVGTVADLIAQGPAQSCAGCTRVAVDPTSRMPQNDGLFSRKGWVVLCSVHKAAAQSQPNRTVTASVSEVSRSFKAPAPTLSRGQQPVTSISARFASRQQMKRQKMTRRKQARNPAGRTGVAAPEYAATD